MRATFLAVLLCLGCAPAAPKAPTFTRVGVILNPDAGTKYGRDGCSSGALGGKLLYTFGDTLFTTPAVDGHTARSNTAAWAELDAPTVLHEPLDANGLPSQFIAFTADEQTYNDTTAKGDDRYVLWPGKVIPRADGQTGVVFFNLFRAHPDRWEGLGTGTAEVKAGETTATRAPNLLFTAPEVDFSHAAFVRDGTVHVYGCDGFSCRLARAPLDRLTERAAYEFWNGNGWSSKYADAVSTIPGSAAGFSVNWNEFLGQYVSFVSLGFGKDIEMRVAANPWGPFSEPTKVFTAERGTVYAAGQHPGLDANGGQRLFVSAYNDLGNFQGEIVLFSVDLTK